MSGKGMASWEALARALPKGVKAEVAKVLGISPSTIHKWCRSAEDDWDTGRRNPLDRIEAIIRASLGHQVPEADALAPLHYLAGAFNHACIPLPRAMETTRGHALDMINVIGEFSDFTRANADALGDGKLERAERTIILKEGDEAVRAILGLMARIQQTTPEPGS